MWRLYFVTVEALRMPEGLARSLSPSPLPLLFLFLSLFFSPSL